MGDVVEVPSLKKIDDSGMNLVNKEEEVDVICINYTNEANDTSTNDDGNISINITHIIKWLDRETSSCNKIPKYIGIDICQIQWYFCE